MAFTNILKHVADEHRSGELQIVSGNWVKTIRIDDGAVRFAKSNMRQDRLGESMLAHDCISKNDYRLASERMAHDGCRFGEALLKLGRLDRKQLHRELGVQVQRIVLSLFRVSEGLYSFEQAETERLHEAQLPYSLSVPPLLLKGLRRIDDGRLILGALPPADTVVRMAERPVYNLDLSKLAAAERSVLERAGDGETIGDIVRGSELDRSAALKACYALLTLGLLDVVSDEVEEEIAEPVQAELIPESSVAVVEEAAETVVEDTQLDGDVERRNRMEQLERDAKLHLQVKDWNGAISLLHELVALAPEAASYQVMLGQAMEFHPTLSKTAEEHFVQAVALAPNDASAHVALGRYYQGVKKRARAIEVLERALELEPGNVDAQRYLERNPAPSRMSKLVSKIFG